MRKIKFYNTKDQVDKTKMAFGKIKDETTITKVMVNVVEIPKVTKLISKSVVYDVYGCLTGKYDETKVDYRVMPSLKGSI